MVERIYNTDIEYMESERLGKSSHVVITLLIQLATILVVVNAERGSAFCAGNNYIVAGRVVDRETGQPVAGVTLRETESNKGTYTSTNGTFRLPLPLGRHKIKFSSLGYESLRIDVDGRADSLVIRLKPLPVSMKGVEVTGDIDVDFIIKRAIRQKIRNLNKIKTFSGLLYSKLVLETGGNLIGAAGDNSFSVSGPFSASGSENEMKYLVMETFSRNYSDFTKNLVCYDIIQRRQTANIKPQSNLLAFGNFLSFYGETIKLLNAEIPAPLNARALDYYKFELKEKKMLDDRYVYIISVKPKSRTYPTFAGTISIVEGTYNMIEADLSPSDATAIPIVNDLRFIQKFEEIEKNLWYPTFLETTGKADIEVIKGLLTFKAGIKVTSIFSEMKVNAVIPDSVFANRTSLVSVASGADSADTGFWKENSLRDITPRELSMYSKIDSIVKKRPAEGYDSSFADFKFPPYFDFNRVSSIAIGLSPALSTDYFDIESGLIYSAGLKRFFGKAEAIVGLIDNDNCSLNLELKCFSAIRTLSNLNNFDRLINSATTALFAKDYYDYFRADGWYSGLDFEIGQLNLWAGIEAERHFSLKQTVGSSLFDSKLRSNPAISAGFWKIARSGLSFGKVDFLNFRGNIQYEIDANVTLGKKDGSSPVFKSIDAAAELNIPTFQTGYQPMMLGIVIQGGVQSGETPVQFMFRMPTNLLFIGSIGTFASAPPDKFGGNEFIATHLSFNSGDLWWRAIGLPTFNNRGLDLSVCFSSGCFNSHESSFYEETGTDFYSEAGFGISRIPTFISNTIFLGTEFRWGVGRIAKGNFGWTLTASLPF